MLTPSYGYNGLTPEQNEILMSQYDMMSPRMTSYDPLRMNAYTGGQLGYMPQSQFLTPASYGAFRSMPTPYSGNMPNQQPTFWQNLIAAEQGFGIFSSYNPAMNQQLFRAQASRRLADDGFAVGANVGDFFANGVVSSVIGKGIAGFLGMGGLAAAGFGLGASMILPSLATPFIDRVREARAIQQNTMSKIVSGRDMDLLTGMGFGPAAAAEMDRFIRRESADDILFKEGDYRNILNIGIQTGMFDFSNSAEQYKEKIRQLRKNFTSAMEILGSTDFQDILKEFQRLQTMGAASSQFNSVLRAENAFSRMVGISHREMVNTYGAQGAVMYSQVGLDGYTGSLRNMANAAAITMAQRQGLISESRLSRFGGVSGYAQRMTEQDARVEHNLMDIIASNIMDDGFRGLDRARAQDFLNGLANGSIPLSAWYNRANDIYSSPDKMNNFGANRTEAYSQFSAAVGTAGMENVIMTLAARIGESLDKNASIQQQMLLGLRSVGYDPAVAQQKVLQYFDPTYQAQRQREQDLERAQRAAEYYETNTPGKRFLRGIARWWEDVSDNVFGAPVRRYLSGSDAYAEGNTPFLTGLGAPTLSAPRPAGAYSPNTQYGGEARFSRSANPIWESDRRRLSYEELLAGTEVLRAGESGTSADIHSVIQRHRDSSGNVQAVTYGSHQMHSRTLMPEFYRRVQADAGRGDEAASAVLESLFDGRTGLSNSEVANMAKTDDFISKYVELAKSQSGYMNQTYADTISQNFADFRRSTRNSDVVQAMLGRGIMSDTLSVMVNHGGGAGAAQAVREYAEKQGWTAADIERLSDQEFYNRHAKNLFMAIAGKDEQFSTSQVSANFDNNIAPVLVSRSLSGAPTYDASALRAQFGDSLDKAVADRNARFFRNHGATIADGRRAMSDFIQDAGLFGDYQEALKYSAMLEGRSDVSLSATNAMKQAFRDLGMTPDVLSEVVSKMDVDYAGMRSSSFAYDVAKEAGLVTLSNRKEVAEAMLEHNDAMRQFAIERNERLRNDVAAGTSAAITNTDIRFDEMINKKNRTAEAGLADFLGQYTSDGSRTLNYLRGNMQAFGGLEQGIGLVGLAGMLHRFDSGAAFDRDAFATQLDRALLGLSAEQKETLLKGIEEGKIKDLTGVADAVGSSSRSAFAGLQSAMGELKNVRGVKSLADQQQRFHQGSLGYLDRWLGTAAAATAYNISTIAKTYGGVDIAVEDWQDDSKLSAHLAALRRIKDPNEHLRSAMSGIETALQNKDRQQALLEYSMRFGITAGKDSALLQANRVGGTMDTVEFALLAKTLGAGKDSTSGNYAADLKESARLLKEAANGFKTSQSGSKFHEGVTTGLGGPRQVLPKQGR